MLSNLKELLQNSQLRKKIKAATDQSAVIELILIASADKGYIFTIESVSKFLTGLTTTSHELSEDDLLGVSGGIPPVSHYGCHTSPNICD